MTANRVHPTLPWKSLLGPLALAAVLTAVAPLIVALVAASQSPKTNVPAEASPSDSQLIDTTDQQGSFSIGDMQYTVLLHEKLLRSEGKPSPETAANASTLVGLQIVDGAGNAAFQETFPYALADGRFAETLAASASMLSGTGGSAILVRFVQKTNAAPNVQPGPAQESWQIFGVVNGHLAPFGAVLPLGQGKDITVNGVVAGVMTPNGIAVVPLTSTAEELPLPAWAGNFYAFVPVRIDWTHGEWGEGEQCYQLAEGALQQKGCAMRVNAQPQTPIGGVVGSVRLFAATDGNTYNSENVSVGPQSQVDFLQALAIVHWTSADQRAACGLDDVWLQVQIDGKQGWVHGEQAFETLGLPHLYPH